MFRKAFWALFFTATIAWSAPRAIPLEARTTNPEVDRFIAETRASADGFVFLCGGASKISPDVKKMLLAMFDGFRLLARDGHRFAVGDGGTKSGIMEAVGQARAGSTPAFPLIGVCPAEDVALEPTEGKTQVDPNHSTVVLVSDRAWREPQGWEPSWGHWGLETATMYGLFNRLAEKRPSVAVIANGGGITLDEVAENLRARRPMIVIWGSGRAADAICAALTGLDPVNLEPEAAKEFAKLQKKVADLRVAEHRDLIRVLPLASDGASLARAVAAALR